jgi:hypothetical protein
VIAAAAAGDATWCHNQPQTFVSSGVVVWSTSPHDEGLIVNPNPVLQDGTIDANSRLSALKLIKVNKKQSRYAGSGHDSTREK